MNQDIEAQKQAILNNTDRVICPTYGMLNMSKAACLQRYKNATGWKQNNNPKSERFEASRLNKPGALDINCQKCEQGKKLMEQKNKPQETSKPAIGKFVKFDKQKKVLSPAISSYQDVRIRFNISSVREYKIRDFKSVDIYFSKPDKTIGIKFLKELSVGSYKLSHSVGHSSINSQAFMRHNKIDPFRHAPFLKSDIEEDFYTAQLK